MTIGESATHYLHLLRGETQLQSQPELSRFIRWLGGHRTWGTLTSHEIASYTDTFGATPDLVKRLEPVKSFLSWAKKEGYTSSNLGTNLRPPKTNGSRPAAARRERAHEPAFLTQEGHQNLIAELDALKAERPKITEALRLAMADKDFRENAPLDAARDQQAHMEARIRDLEALLKRAQVMDGAPAATVRAQLGSTVVLWDLSYEEELRFTLVHPNEVNVAQGKVSVASPMGRALLDRTAGEEIEVVAPAGVHRYRIQAVNGSA